MAPTQKPGVFCLEGAWDSDLRRKSSVRPLLELLEGQDLIDSIHRDAGTEDELHHYLKTWTQKRYDKYKLLYLAFHGEPGVVWIGRRKVSIESIAESLNGNANGAVVYIGACGTLDVSKRELDSFLKVSGAKAVCGYSSTDVDWLESAAFELLLIEALTRFRRIDAAERWLKKEYASTLRRLKFKLHR